MDILKKDKLRIQRLFPKRVLSDEEIEWCVKYENKTNFEVTFSDNAETQIDFIEVMRYNIKWFRGWAEEEAKAIDRDMSKLSYYEKHG